MASTRRDHSGPTCSPHGSPRPVHASTHALSTWENAGSSLAPEATTTAMTRLRAAIRASRCACDGSVYCSTSPRPTCGDGAPEHARLYVRSIVAQAGLVDRRVRRSGGTSRRPRRRCPPRSRPRPRRRSCCRPWRPAPAARPRGGPGSGVGSGARSSATSRTVPSSEDYHGEREPRSPSGRSSHRAQRSGRASGERCSPHAEATLPAWRGRRRSASPGQSGRRMFRGSRWSSVSTSAERLAAGAALRPAQRSTVAVAAVWSAAFSCAMFAPWLRARRGVGVGVLRRSGGRARHPTGRRSRRRTASGSRPWTPTGRRRSSATGRAWPAAPAAGWSSPRTGSGSAANP